MASVLVVDDDPKICLFFGELLEQMALDYEVAQTLKAGRTLSQEQSFDLVLLDLELPDGNGLELLPEITTSPSSPEVIIITGTGDVRGAEFAFKYGAWDYVQKPFLLNEVSLPITRALQYRKEKMKTTRLVNLDRSGIIGESDAIRKSLEELGKAARTGASVLITGETGTGKELFSKAIHKNSSRAAQPFIAVDCGALPETLLESTLFGHERGAFTGATQRQDGLLSQADGGTLMLDEIGDLPLTAQKSFLRVLQERAVRRIGGSQEIPVDIRLVAATNLDLDQMVAEKRFRQDLLFRIRAIEIQLPPLRNRREDIEEITLKKLHELSKRYGISTKAISTEFLDALSTYEWPGNVRELVNVLEHALAAVGDDPMLYPKHLPLEHRMANLDFKNGGQASPSDTGRQHLSQKEFLPPLKQFRADMEKQYLLELIDRSEGDRKSACDISGISQSRLYGLLKKYNLPGFGTS